MRSLALFRVAFGCVLFMDLLTRLRDISFFYSDQGLLPRDVFLTKLANPWNFSLLLVSGESWVIAILFILSLISCALFILGHKTRLQSLCLWLFVASMHNRNWLINSSADDIIRLFLLISFFLPLDAYYSVESAMSEEKERAKDFFSVWNIILFFQIGIIYFISYLWKDHPRWHTELSAVYYALQIENFSTSLGHFLSSFFPLTQILAFLTYKLEMLGPIILWTSILYGRKWAQLTRFFIAVCFILFHLGLIFTLELGTFPYVLISLWFLFIPSFIWDWGEKKITNPYRSALEIYYDKDCGFCRKLCFILREFCFLSQAKLAEAQSIEPIEKLMREKNSWVVKDKEGREHCHFEAFICFCKHSPVLSSFSFILRFSPIKKIGNIIYRWVSYNRNKVSFLTSPFEIKKRYFFKKWKFLSLCMAFLYFLSSWQWNFQKIAPDLSLKKNFNLIETARWMQTFQEWDMFSPYPLTHSRWYVVLGTFDDGSQKNLLSGETSFVIGEKPKKHLSKIFPSKLWRKLSNNMEKQEQTRVFFLQAMCRIFAYEEVNSLSLKKVQLYLHELPTKNPPNEGGPKKLNFYIQEELNCY